MRQFLFADNFRGFTNAIVPLLDVNFLVGQNSTGKTSLLYLLRLFLGQRLLLQADFSSEGESIGLFNELVSMHSDDKSYFRIGIIQEHKSEGGNTSTALLLTYVNAAGLPQLQAVTAAMGNKEIYLRWDDGKASFRIRSLSSVTTAEDAKALLPGWIKDHESPSELIPLTLPEGLMSNRMPLFVVMTLVAHTVKSSSAKSEQPTIDPGDFQFFWPELGYPLVWIAPIRTKPGRTYDQPQTAFSSEGSHTPYVIRRMLDSEEGKKKFHSFMRRVGKDSALFDGIDVKLFGSPTDLTAPFEIDVILDSMPLKINMVGYGVSQSLPILVELLDRPNGSWFAIQQPEVHLHPKAQAALGDVFFEMAVQDRKRFVIETHSDFTIDRFRMQYNRKSHSQKPNSQVLFFERRDKHNTVTPLIISPDGELPSDQPDSYRKFFIKEQMNLLGL
jgi:hypothetical protein